MTKGEIENSATEQLLEIWKKVLADLESNGIQVGGLVSSKYDGSTYRVTRMLPKIYSYGKKISFNVEINGVKLLASGEWGTHEHGVIID